MVSIAYEPEAEPSLPHTRRHFSNLWRNALVTTLILSAAMCFLVIVGGQAAYVTPLYKTHIQSMISTWWGSHDEMVDPSYLLLVGVAPTLMCVVTVQWLRRLRMRRGVWSVAKFLRRKPSPGWLSYGELLFLLILVGSNALVLWYGFTKKHGHKPRFTGDSPIPPPPGPPSGPSYGKMIGNALGFNCMWNLALLFLPATRGSAWMEVMHVSYANGIKFHRWVGVAAIVTGIVHCGCYYYGWIQGGRWMQLALPCWDCSLRERKGRKIWINVFGEIALLCFLLIGVTSIPYVRRKMYNLFYNVHQLLFVAVIFTILHWARSLWFILPTFVAYLISRALSHCNGAIAVNVVEFSALSPSLCKLVIGCTNSDRGRYQVGQFIYVNIPAISRLEWHAFTLASSPRASLYDENASNSMTLLIKALGDWTGKLLAYEQVCNRCSIEPEVYVDGFYGASLTDVYQAYSTVVLVGGGVGMTPLLGVLEDICAAAETRQAQGRRLLPRRVAVIFTMRELELIKEIYPLLLRVREVDPLGRYITVNLTLTTTPRPEDLDSSIHTVQERKPLPSYSLSQTRSFFPSTKKGCPFGSSLGPSGSAIVHLVAFSVVVGLVVVFQFDNGVLIDGLQESVWVVQAAVKIAALFAAGVCVYGGVLLMRWTRNARTTYGKLKSQYSIDDWGLKETLLPQQRNHRGSLDISTFRDLVSDLHVGIGRRPNLAQHLQELRTDHQRRCSGTGTSIGVIVSGPTSLKTATARAVALIGAGDFDIHEEEFEL